MCNSCRRSLLTSCRCLRTQWPTSNLSLRDILLTHLTNLNKVVSDSEPLAFCKLNQSHPCRQQWVSLSLIPQEEPHPLRRRTFSKRGLQVDLGQLLTTVSIFQDRTLLASRCSKRRSQTSPSPSDTQLGRSDIYEALVYINILSKLIVKPA